MIILETKKLKKFFGGVKAANDCSFEVQQNTITALIGPNGSGKSTVFNLISGVLGRDAGEIFFQGNEISKESPEFISNLGISRLFQQSRLFMNLTVEENLLVALDREDEGFWRSFLKMHVTNKEQKDIVSEILEMVDMTAHRHKQARELSFGQRRLVEIARAIVNHHHLLMLDEPVAGVNPKLRHKIKEILLHLKEKGETILLIEHDMNFTLSVSDWVIVMDEGRVLAKGTPDEIRKNKDVLEAYLGE